MTMNEKNYLDQIILHKKKEVENLLRELDRNDLHPIHKIHKKNISKGNFADALKGNHLAVIAEIKRKSPSQGVLVKITDPVSLALQYCHGNASAISILTDSSGFSGSLKDLEIVSRELKKQFPDIPILRKDFIIHPIQIAETVYAGASSVLLIANILKNDLAIYLKEAKRFNLDALVEVHDERDLNYALEADASIIGVNHRNLTTFHVDLSITERLKSLIPDRCITVAESGIQTITTAQLMRRRGYDAVLVGEALVTSNHPESLIQKMRGLKNES